MANWSKGRGLLGPLSPLIGDWVSPAEDQQSDMPVPCTRSFWPFGKGWIELNAVWQMGSRGDYREIALFGHTQDSGLGVFSFTNDGKRSEGRLADGSDVHPQALAFEAQMPAGLARMIYWPQEKKPGFSFAVESRTRKGWNRFLRQDYRPAT